MKLIDKDALVAKIERIEHEMNYETFTDEVLGKRSVCKSLLSFLNTLEVKEVDLEKEFYDFLDTLIGKDNGHLSEDELFRIAEYFYELGLKVQKGE